ncbi:hypothetical protein BHQ19_28620 [Mycolicibacterium porcinum]|nr:hypothetical protein BHQ19_28620 [Mycolicibacterium porcinum]
MGILDSHAPQTVSAEVTVKFTNEPKPRQLSDTGVSYSCTTEPDGILVVTAKTHAGEWRKRYSPTAWEWYEVFIPSANTGGLQAVAGVRSPLL